MAIDNDLTAYMCIHEGVDNSLLEQSLQSIIDQNTLPGEMIFACDGPLSLSKQEVLAMFRHTFFALGVRCLDCSSPVPVGHGHIRALALSHVTTRYVATCDSDDISSPNRFSMLLSKMRSQPNLAAVGSHVIEKNLLENTSPAYLKTVPLSTYAVRVSLGVRCPLNQMTTLLSVRALRTVGSYEDFYHNEDYYLWYKLLNSGYELCNIDDYLVTAHSDENSIDRRGGVKYFQSEAKMQWLLYKKNYSSLVGFISAITIRFIVQVVFPSIFRKYFYRKFLRKELVDG